MCALHDFGIDLAAPDKILNPSQQDKNLFAAAKLTCTPVSTKSSSVAEKIEAAAALRNNTALWLYSLPSILCRTDKSSSLPHSKHPLTQISSLAQISTQKISAASWCEAKSDSVLVLLYQGHLWLR